MPAIPQLLTIDQAREHVRVVDTYDDVKLALLIQQASAIVLNYINQYPRGEYDTLPVYDSIQPITIAPWPWEFLATTQPPYWWPATKVAYRELPPYLADGWDLSGSPTGEVPGAISAAALLVLGALFADREGKSDPISPAVRSLLSTYRDPSMA